MIYWFIIFLTILYQSNYLKPQKTYKTLELHKNRRVKDNGLIISSRVELSNDI